MDSKKLLLTLNILIIVTVILQVLDLTRGTSSGQTINQGGTGHGGSVENNITVPDHKQAIKERATVRGYYTASEYAQYTDVSLETTYRHAQEGRIAGAHKVEGKWRILLPQSSN